MEEACERGNIIQYLLSDVGQIKQWDQVKKHLSPGDTLYFSHGFGITYKDKTNIIPPSDIDVVLVAPKGAGSTVRNHFLNGSGINASYAIHQDYTGHAKDNTLALAFCRPHLSYLVPLILLLCKQVLNLQAYKSLSLQTVSLSWWLL